MKLLTVLISTLTLAIGLLIGIAWNARSARISSATQYEIDFDTIMGGLGGITVEVTDLKANKAYLYVLPSDPQNNAGAAKLVGTVDLSSVGEDVLNISFSENFINAGSATTVPSIDRFFELANTSTTEKENSEPEKTAVDSIKSIGDEFTAGNLNVKIAKVEKLLLKSSSWTTPSPTVPSFVFTVRVTNLSDGKILTPSLTMSTLDNFGNTGEYISLKVEGNEHKKKLGPGDTATLKEYFMPSIETATQYKCRFKLYEGDSWDDTEFELNFVPSDHVFDDPAG